MPKYSSHLYHYALVNAEFQETRDISSSLKPLIIPILHDIQGKPYNPSEVSRKVMENYGVKMHPLVAEDYAERLAEQGFLEKISSKSQNKKPSYQVTEFEEELDKAEKRRFEVIISSIINTFSELASNFFQNAGLEEPEGVNYHNEFTKRLAYTGVKGSESFEVSETNILDLAFASTITNIFESDEEKKLALEKAYNGAVLSEVVLSIREPSTDLQNISGKKFYIDQPLLINILGFADEYLVDCSRQLIKAVQEYGGIVTTTAAYIDEAKDTIKYGLASYRQKNGPPSPLTTFLMLNPSKFPVVQAAQTNVEFLLQERGFDLSDRFINAGAKLTSQTSKELRHHLHNQLTWYRKPEAMEHDVEAVLHVVSDYGYNTFKSFAESRSFLITSNERLISDCDYVLREKANFKEYEMSPLLSERKFAVLLWILSGTEDSESDLSSISLLANCSKAMELNGLIMEKIRSFFESLEPDSIALFERVVTSERLLHTLVEEVGGNADNLTPENFGKVAKRAEDKVSERLSTNSEALSRARNQIGKQAKEIGRRRSTESSMRRTLKDLQDQSKAELNSASRRAKLAEQEKRRLETAMERTQKEAEQGKKEARDTIDSREAETRQKLESFFETLFKAVLVIIIASGALWVNSKYSGDGLATLVGFILTVCMTWVMPQLIFNRPIKLAAERLTNKLLSNR